MMILNAKDRVVIPLINKTGSASVKGQVVMVKSDSDHSYAAATADGIVAFGVVLLSGIPDGGYVPICVFGRCQVLFGTGLGSTRGNWATISRTEAGLAASVYEAFGDIFAQGLGMVLETVGGVEATNKLVWISFVPSKSKDVPVANGGS